MKGAFNLRSFYSILNFLGRSIGEMPEYYVEKDPRTPPITRDVNPINTLELLISDTSNREAELSIYSHGQYYAVDTIGTNAIWNKNTFQLLSILFQMTITDPPSIGTPSITIAK